MLQVLLNFLSNSLKFTKQGKITIAMKVRDLTSREEACDKKKSNRSKSIKPALLEEEEIQEE